MMHSRLRPLLSGVVLRSQSDARLAQLACDGHQLAFTTVFERYQRELGVHAARIVRPSRAEDVVQDAMLNAWSALLSGEVVAEPRAWLHRIVHNVALNAVARRGYDDTEIPATTVSPLLTDDIAERRMSAAEALAAVAALPEAQRRALTLTALEGHSATQAAADIGVSETAMRQLVYRARSSVRSAVSAVTPLPIIMSALQGAGGAATVGGAGAAGALSGVAAKTAVVFAVAAGGAGATAVVSHENDRHTSARHAQTSSATGTTSATTASTGSELPTGEVTHRAARSMQQDHSGGSGSGEGRHGSAGTRGDRGANGRSNTSGGTSGGASHGSTGMQGSSGGNAGENGSTSSNGSDGSTPHGAQGSSAGDSTPGAPPTTQAPLQPNERKASTSHDVGDGTLAAPSVP